MAKTLGKGHGIPRTLNMARKLGHKKANIKFENLSADIKNNFMQLREEGRERARCVAWPRVPTLIIGLSATKIRVENVIGCKYFEQPFSHTTKRRPSIISQSLTSRPRRRCRPSP
jgi:hypothetical protein